MFSYSRFAGDSVIAAANASSRCLRSDAGGGSDGIGMREQIRLKEREKESNGAEKEEIDQV